MNAEISQVQRQIIGLYSKQLMYLRGKPRQFLNDLQHEARELMKVPKADEFSLHVAACINDACCAILLDPEFNSGVARMMTPLAPAKGGGL